MKRAAWIFILTSLVITQGAVNGTVKGVTADLFGKTYHYKVIEADFQEELFLLQQRACPCLDSICTAPTVPDQNSNPNYTALQPNQWHLINGTLEAQYFQFVIPNTPNKPCPIVVFAMDPIVGSPPDVRVSAGQFPTPDDFLLASLFYGNQDIWICDFKFTFGTYYAGVTPSNMNLFTSYRVKYYLLDPLPCVPPLPDPFPSDGQWEWLYDGIAKYSYTSPGHTVPFKFFVNQKCANVTVAVYKTSSEGDVDVSLDLDLLAPSGKNARWFTASDADDAVAIAYCSDKDNFVINVGINVWYGSENTTFVVVATTRVFMPVAVNEYTYRKVVSALSWGSAYLECPDFTELCNFPAYEDCQYDRGDFFGCCQSLYPLAPTLVPNPIFPWNVVDQSLPWMNTIPWNEPLDLVPNKLSWSLYLGYVTPTSNELKYSTPPDLTQCVIKFKNRIITKDGLPLDTSISITKKQFSCNFTNFNRIAAEMSSIISKMYNEDNLLDLSLQQSQLAVLNFDDNIAACQGVVVDKVPIITQNQSFSNFTTCLEDTTDHNNCCPDASSAYLDVCCLPSSYLMQYQHLIENPSASSCLDKKRNEFVLLHNSGDCNVQFVENADLSIQSELKQFIEDCRNSMVGETAQGIPCKSDEDCLTNCDPIYKKCQSNDTLILQCFADNIDLVLMRILINNWGSNDTSNDRSQFVNIFAQYLLKPLCTGPTGIKYQNHYEFTSPYSCNDCIEPSCFDTSCAIPVDCSYLVSTCPRSWTFFPENPSMCLSDYQCNWMDCNSISNISDCSAVCLNSSLSSEVCLNCASGYCVEVTGFDELMCSEGLCSFPQYSSAECLSQYECSIPCENCTKEKCESLGTCSDTDIIQQLLLNLPNATGVCITEILNDYTTVYCGDSSDPPFSYGCADFQYLNETSCISAGGTWRTPAYTESDCLSFKLLNSSYGVFRADLGIFTRIPIKNGIECGLDILPYVTWTPANWKQGEIQPLLWTTRSYNHTNSFSNTIDYYFFGASIDSAIGVLFSYSFVTEAQCRYIQPSSVISEFSCLSNSQDCDTNLNEPVQSGVGLVCSGLPSTVKNDFAKVNFVPESIPGSTACVSVGLYTITSNQFQNSLGYRLSSEIFKSVPPNMISVVLNDKGAITGQLVSDGFMLKIGDQEAFDFQYPVQICFSLDKARFVESDQYTIYGIGDLRGDNIYVNSTSVNFLIENEEFCGNISQSGTYFGIKITLNNFNYESSTMNQAIASVVIFILVLFVALFQAVMLLIFERRKLIFKIFSMLLVLIFLSTRIAYSTLFAFNEDSSNTSLILYELPTFLFFLEYFSVLYLWTEVLIEVKLLGKKSKIPFTVFLTANILITLLFIIFISTFYNLPEYYPTQPCEKNSLLYTSNERGLTNLIYAFVVSLILIIIAIIFVILGVMFLSRLESKMSTMKSPAVMTLYHTTIVLVACFAICFLIRSILTIIALLTTFIPSLVLMSILEAVPCFVLALYLYPHGYLHIKHSSSTKFSSSKSKTERSRVTHKEE